MAKSGKRNNKSTACMISFLICMTFILLHCYIRKVWLFGEQSLLLGDAGEQYIYFMSELWDKLHNGGSLFYSRHAGMGYDFYTNAAYYLCSPFNLIVLFVPKGALEDAVQGIMVLKWALCSVTMTYYVLNTRRNTVKQLRAVIAVTAGLAYSFSRFLLGYMFCFIWYDVIMLLPLVVLSMEDMMETGKWKRYYILLLVSMICNFYMAFIVCLFLCVSFLSEKWESFEQTKRKAGRFAAVSMLAALTSMVVILPCAVMQLSRYEGSDAYARRDGIVCRLWELVKGAYILRPLEGAEDCIPHLYIGVALALVILTVPFVNNTFEWKCRKIGVLLFFGISFLVPWPNLLWHAGTVPHSYYHRFGFVVVFFGLQLFVELFPLLSSVRIRYYITVIVAAFVCIAVSFFKETDLYDYYVYLTMFMLTVIYGILLILYRKKSLTHKMFSYIICGMTVIELLVNVYVILEPYQTISTLQGEEASAVYNLDKQCELESGERISFTDTNVDKGMWLGRESVSGFSSFPNRKLMNLMHSIGVSGFENDAAVEYSGGTPLDNIIFNVKYGIAKSGMRFSDADVVAVDDEYSLFCMRRTAGLGYMTKTAVFDWDINEKNVFAMRNNFAQLAAGIDDVFEILPNDVSCMTLGKNYKPDAEGAFSYSMLNELDCIVIEYTVPRDMDLYMYLRNSESSRYFIEIDGEEFGESDKTEKTLMVHVGEVKAFQNIQIKVLINASKDLEGTIICQMAAFNEKAFAKVYSMLSRDTMQIEQYTDDCIRGKISVVEDGLLVTSIQAVDGMKVYVDDGQVSYDTVLGDTFIAVPLSKGTHTMVVKYQTPYWLAGLLLTISGIAIYMFVVLRHKLESGWHTGNLE